MKYTRPRGTKDIFGDEAKAFQNIEEACRNVFALYNYQEIKTPIFESLELFTRSIGKETDIVSKEMYEFEDKGGRKIALRPEETAPVVRAAIENNLIQQDQILKLFYVGPMFRYERPQAGRYRQFYQAGVEVFCSSDPMLDFEVIDLNLQILQNLGVPDLEVNINCVCCLNCRDKYVNALKKYLRENLSSMCEDCKERYKKNPMRVMDCKNEKCQKIIAKTPETLPYVCENCSNSFNAIKGLLDKAEIPYKVNNRLVRGLDYYTGTAFEIISKKLGAQNAVSGGGRYDNLVEELGGKATPAVGFALGIDRIMENYAAGNIPLKVYLIALGDKAKQKAFELLRDLRAKGISADMDYVGKSMKSQMKTADKLKAEKVIIIGEDELIKNKVLLKNMYDGKQEELVCDSSVIIEALA